MIKITKQVILRAFLLLLIAGNHSYSFAFNTTVEQNQFNEKLPKPIIQNSLGSFYEDFSENPISTELFNKQLVPWFGLNEKHTFEKVREYIDEIGYKHETFQHIYKGIKVESNLVFVHSKANKVTSVNGQLLGFKDLDINYSLSDDEIIAIGTSDFPTASKVFNSPVELIISKVLSNDGTDLILTKKVKIFSLKPINSIFYFIDNTGKIVKQFKTINKADVPGSGSTYYSGTQNFTVDSFGSQYRLKDNARKIHTHNAINIDFNEFTGAITGTQDYFNNTTSYTSNNTKAPVEVHWGMTKAYDYFKNVHNRNSYDGQGSIINNYYNYPDDIEDTENAFAADFGNFVGMFFGSGGTYFNPLVKVDVAGHEFSHLIIGRNGNGGLDYYGESGALNESFADIFGTSIEFYANVNPNWTIGEGIVKPFITPSYLRNMSNPNDGPAFFDGQQPDTYNGNYWVNPAHIFNDNGGVHTNSGVGNFWYYLLADYGTHTGVNDIGNSYAVQGIGINKAEKIVYKALMEGLTPSATYLDAVNATKQAAIALYGLNSLEYNQVVNAWYAVGFGSGLASVNKNELKVNLSVYPNPTKDGNFVVDSQIGANVSLQAFDMLGKHVSPILNIEQGTNTINFNHLANGIYFLVFKSNGVSHTEKLIKN